MIRRFLKDKRGNFAIMTAIAMVPIMGALTLAIDYSEMSRRRQLMLNSLDAAGIATARYLLGGVTDAAAKTYATEFFNANLSRVIDPADTILTVVLPKDNVGSGTLSMCSNLKYHPYFLPAFYALLAKEQEEISFDACTEIKLQNTLEVALVLDNSGSMDEKGPGASGTRMELLREAAEELVDTFALRADSMKQVEAPVQFSLVPFAASVNIGSTNAGEAWMDTQGISPIHHENFTWPLTLAANKEIRCVASVCKKKGNGWPVAEREQTVTRFSLLNDIKRYKNSAQTQTEAVFKWDGCVEARPYPFNIEDKPASAHSDGVSTITGDPATLFVPMFGPDEYGQAWDTNSTAPNSWWNDFSSGTAVARQLNTSKYFEIRPYNKSTPSGKGPNYSCTTTPITQLADLADADGKTNLVAAIRNMSSGGSDERSRRAGLGLAHLVA